MAASKKYQTTSEVVVEEVVAPEAAAEAQVDAEVAGAADVTAEAEAETAGTQDAEASDAKAAEKADGTVITVICHSEGGRRRVGRRWDKGETIVAEGELSDMDLQILRADPRFTVKG